MAPLPPVTQKQTRPGGIQTRTTKSRCVEKIGQFRQNQPVLLRRVRLFHFAICALRLATCRNNTGIAEFLFQTPEPLGVYVTQRRDGHLPDRRECQHRTSDFSLWPLHLKLRSWISPPPETLCGHPGQRILPYQPRITEAHQQMGSTGRDPPLPPALQPWIKPDRDPMA